MSVNPDHQMAQEQPIQFPQYPNIQIRFGSFKALDLTLLKINSLSSDPPRSDEHSSFSHSELSSPSALLEQLRSALEFAEQYQSTRGAVNVLIPASMLSSGASDVLDELQYKFLVHDNFSSGGPFFIWYKWCRVDVANRVPQAFTSRLGAGAIILSPDEQSVLLIEQPALKGQLHYVMGTVDLHETSLEAAKREALEETGVIVDETFEPLLACGFQCPFYHEFGAADVFLCFVLRATSIQLDPDFSEIIQAKWVPLSELRPLLFGEPDHWSLTNSHVRYEGQTVRPLTVRALRQYLSGGAKRLSMELQRPNAVDKSRICTAISF